MSEQDKRLCSVFAGRRVEWDGRLTPTQCEAFPVIGTEWPDHPNRIEGFDQGSRASAYQHAENPSKVVKFTADKDDAEVSALVAKNPLKGTVRIFDVAELKGQKAISPVAVVDSDNEIQFDTLPNQPVYAIIAERVNPTERQQTAATKAFWDKYRPAREEVRHTPPSQFRVSNYVEFNDAVSMCFQSGESKENCELNMKDIFAAVDEQAREIGVIPLDLHSRNWGIRNGHLVILDLGISAGKEKSQKIRQLAGTGAKGKKMAKRKHRRSLGQTDMAVYDPSQPSRVTGFNWRNPWVLGGAAAALGLFAWFAFGGKKDKKKKPSPTSSGSSAAPASGGGVVLPATASSTTPTAPQRVRAASGDSWSVIAKKYYGDTRWWPALWDANRSGGSKFSDPSLLRVGDEVVVPVLPVTDSAFRAAVFARATAYQTWYRTSGGKISSRNPLPATVTEFTSAPTQNAAAGTQVSSQTAAESSSGQKALPPASASPPAEMSTEEELNLMSDEMSAELDARSKR